MTEKGQGKFEGLVSASTNREGAIKVIKSLLNAEDIKKLGGDADSASEKLIDAMAYFVTPLASKTDTFDIRSFNDAAEGLASTKEEGIIIIDTLEKIGALKENPDVKVGEPREFRVSSGLVEMIENPRNGFYEPETAKRLNVRVAFGSIEVPGDWKVDDQGRYAQTTKEKALKFFNEKEWEILVLAQAAIEVSRNQRAGGLNELEQKRGHLFPQEVFEASNRGVSRPIFFVTGGWSSYFWDTAKDVVIQEVTSSEQIQRDFSGDVPEGKFFIKRIKEQNG